MAHLTLDDFTIETLEAKAQFADLSDIIPSTAAAAPQEWNDNIFGSIIIWSGVRCDQNVIPTLGATWATQISSGAISPRTAANGLKLALSLTSMNPGAVKYLITQHARPSTAQVGLLAAENMPTIESFSATSYALRAHQVFPTEAGGAPHIPVPVTVPLNLDQIEADSDAQKIHAYCFIAAYLMKLLVRDPSNIINGLANMKLRYNSFYGPSRTVTTFVITIEQAAAYKEALSYTAKLGVTYTHAIANTHQYSYDNLDSKEAGALSYLCFLPFSYIGMHAYSLMMELRSYTRVPLPKLLTLFYSDITAPALNKIGRIIRDFERTTVNPNKSILFRYCSHWGSQYFHEVRSKQCAHLLCVVVHAWKVLAAGHQNSDPDRIAALTTLGESMKATLRIAGEAAGGILKKNMIGGDQAGRIFTFALAHGAQDIGEEVEGENVRNAKLFTENLIF